jgi:hypothetical protein
MEKRRWCGASHYAAMAIDIPPEHRQLLALQSAVVARQRALLTLSAAS